MILKRLRCTNKLALPEVEARKYVLKITEDKLTICEKWGRLFHNVSLSRPCGYAFYNSETILFCSIFRVLSDEILS